jgi:hypothetical protein
MTTRQVDQWLVTAPQETFEAILDVTAERSKQEEKGWTTEHDDEHGVEHLLRESSARLGMIGAAGFDRERIAVRAEVVTCAALLVAAIEVLDRVGLPRSSDSGVNS